ncbi:hypothetical protein MUS1_13900 [Marinomonas ushuaiensis DSM 15871]|uniref:Uncharacterized protein n=1 Tax=Marinomonas ushuaiensis DSM 15871 TaxID=1122207 RepID=X7E671_9GAMM|nr:hypothetical protein [Marinomonas ushuaiensis]ETX10673.1 hypothetical protein MUS1_13900 [Marinomonas ushuaiensis DSM 15871]
MVNFVKSKSNLKLTHAALNGAGIAFAWDWHVDELLKSGQLIALTQPIDCDKNGFFSPKTKLINITFMLLTL